jgi:thiol-disulfide isomerase/thioredoxin
VRSLLFIAGWLAGAPAWAAAPLQDAGAIPQLSERGRAAYREFLAAPHERAFAIAPGGTWAWHGAYPDMVEVQDAALADCQQNTVQQCVLYAINDRVVFDPAKWASLWGPYPTAAEAAQAPTGMRRGDRFPDLAFRGADGQARKLSELRGKVVVLHFWGSWCPPCRREMPDLQRLYDVVREHPEIRFVLLPVREPYAQARRWADQIGVRMPIFDTGLRDEADEELRLADGGRILDRNIARAFPTTYVLDKHGVVLFSHVGAASRWLVYAPFLRDAATKSGR